jgi:hypothetical protein
MKSLLASIFLCIAMAAHGATFKYAPFNPKRANSVEAIHITGEIRVGDLEVLRAFIRTDVGRFKQSSIVLASNGGDVLEAMKISDVIRSSYMTVFVSEDIGVCASACFLIYVSAVERGSTDRALGVHRP